MEEAKSRDSGVAHLHQGLEVGGDKAVVEIEKFNMLQRERERERAENDLSRRSSHHGLCSRQAVAGRHGL